MMTQNPLTTVENLPEHLCKIPQWVCYGLQLTSDTVKKIPYSYRDTSIPIDVTNSVNWGTFEQVLEARKRDPLNIGLGFVLTKQANVTCFDIDGKNPDPDVQRRYERARKGLDKPSLRTWCETSVSGKGEHHFFIGGTPDETASMNNVNPGMEIYLDKRFIALTGRKLPQSTDDLTTGNGIVMDIYEERKKRSTASIASAGSDPLGISYELGRGVMTRERALALLADTRPVTYGYLMEPAPDGQGSDRLFETTLHLDKIIADPAEIFSIIETSALGLSRPNGLWRKFSKYWIRDARASNTAGIRNRTKAEDAYLVSHGRLLAEQWSSAWFREMTGLPLAQTAGTVEPPADDPPDVEISSDVKRHLLSVLPKSPQPSRELQAFVKANMAGMKTPQADFAMAATLYFMGGLCSLNYRTSDDQTTVLFVLLIAISAAGKGEAFEYWVSAFNTICDGSLVKKGSVASKQGLHCDLQDMRVLLHYRADAGNDINSLANPKTSQDAAISDMVSDMFDMSSFGQRTLHPNTSISGRARDDRPVSGVRYSPGFLCTPSAFNNAYNPETISRGIGSRALAMVRDGVVGDLSDDETIQRCPPKDIAEWIGCQFDRVLALGALYTEFDNLSPGGKVLDVSVRALARAQRDAAWSKIEAATITVPYTPEARQLLKRLESVVNDVRKGLASQKVDKNMTVYARVAVLTKKLALIDGTVGKHGAVQITEENVAWAAHYVIECMATLAKWFDEGGGNSGDDAKREKAVLGWIGLKGTSMSLSELKKRASCNKLFIGHKFGTTDGLMHTLKALETEGRITSSKVTHGLRYTRLR